MQVPNIFQQAGWLFPTIMFLFTGVFIGIVAMYLAKAVALVREGRILEAQHTAGHAAGRALPLPAALMWCVHPSCGCTHHGCLPTELPACLPACHCDHR